MQPLEPPDCHYLSAAIGWLELGNLKEAKLELGFVETEHQHHPDVLEVRWLLCAEEQRWDQGLTLARLLIEHAPERASGWLHQAYALRRVAEGGLDQAWQALLPVAEKFPKEPTVSYNLACYACQMHQLELARDWLKRAMDIGGRERIRQMALTDPDLQPLWPEFSQL